MRLILSVWTPRKKKSNCDYSLLFGVGSTKVWEYDAESLEHSGIVGNGLSYKTTEELVA